MFVCIMQTDATWIVANHLSSSVLAETAECENGLIKPRDNVTCISVCSPGPRRRRHSVRQEPLVKLISNSFDIHFIASRLQEIRQGVVFAGEIISFLRYANEAYLYKTLNLNSPREYVYSYHDDYRQLPLS